MTRVKSLLGSLAQDMFSHVLKRFVQTSIPPSAKDTAGTCSETDVVDVEAWGHNETHGIVTTSSKFNTITAPTSEILKTLDLVTGGNHFSHFVTRSFSSIIPV